MEYFDIYDASGGKIGRASRAICHGGSFLLHKVVHVLVFTSGGRVILQKRALSKDIQPGKWDTSVGGHLTPGERVEQALVREASEELGIENAVYEFLYEYLHASDREREIVAAYRCVLDGPFRVQAGEIDEIREFSAAEIDTLLGSGMFTGNFEDEWRRYRERTDGVHSS